MIALKKNSKALLIRHNRKRQN